MAKFVSIQTKFINLSKKILFGTAGALLLASIIFIIIIINKTFSEARESIFNAKIEKGKLLISNQCLALSSSAQENAFSIIQELVSATVASDNDLIYGIYMDNIRQVWIDARPKNPQGTIAFKLILKDSVALWAHALHNPSYRLLQSGEIIEFAGPVFGQDNSKLGTIRYGFTTVPLNESILKAQHKFYFSIISSSLIIGIIGIAIFFVSMKAAQRQANAITSPLKKLTGAVDTVANGNYAVPLALDSNDEIGVLAENFEKMRHTIKQYTDNLETMVSLRTEELKDTMRELQRSNIELEQFAYVTSHDLREPLRMITMYVTLLKKNYNEKFDDNARAFMAFATDGVARMQNLIDDLLTLSRVSTKARPMELVDCGTILEMVLKNLEIAIAEKKAVIRFFNLPTLYADKNHLIQLLQNLIANALKFCPDRVPEITITAKDTADLWEFTVSDNGIGIAQKYWDTIFQIFQRLHTREEYEGTGIGLAVCKKIVERYNGRIWVESQLGSGSTFLFTIPKKPTIRV